mmetsp:Transcript_232/g.426  ORF Transcript_232/g.426 Transcript_232/m.426 type:complete len:291 (+) Transcript_232:240-1112(+)
MSLNPSVPQTKIIVLWVPSFAEGGGNTCRAISAEPLPVYPSHSFRTFSPVNEYFTKNWSGWSFASLSNSSLMSISFSYLLMLSMYILVLSVGSSRTIRMICTSGATPVPPATKPMRSHRLEMMGLPCTIRSDFSFPTRCCPGCKLHIASPTPPPGIGVYDFTSRSKMPSAAGCDTGEYDFLRSLSSSSNELLWWTDMHVGRLGSLPRYFLPVGSAKRRTQESCDWRHLATRGYDGTAMLLLLHDCVDVGALTAVATLQRTEAAAQMVERRQTFRVLLRSIVRCAFTNNIR